MSKRWFDIRDGDGRMIVQVQAMSAMDALLSATNDFATAYGQDTNSWTASETFERKEPEVLKQKKYYEIRSEEGTLHVCLWAFDALEAYQKAQKYAFLKGKKITVKLAEEDDRPKVGSDGPKFGRGMLFNNGVKTAKPKPEKKKKRVLPPAQESDDYDPIFDGSAEDVPGGATMDDWDNWYEEAMQELADEREAMVAMKDDERYVYTDPTEPENPENANLNAGLPLELA